METYRGKTTDAQSPIVGAEFWNKGVTLSGKVLRSFKTTNGLCYELRLFKPVVVNGETEPRVSVGAMAGFQMALSAAGLSELRRDDVVTLECVGKTETTKGNPRVDFEIEVKRG